MIHKLKEILTTKGMREAGFPSKVSLPLYLGVNAAVTFDNCKVFKPGELEPDLFLVNPQYSSSRRMRKVSVLCFFLRFVDAWSILYVCAARLACFGSSRRKASAAKDKKARKKGYTIQWRVVLVCFHVAIQ